MAGAGIRGIHPHVDAIDLPLGRVPEPRLAGRFALADRGYATTYRGLTHALHLHDYAGRMRLAGADVGLALGDATLSPADLPSAYDLPSPGRHWCVHFVAPADGGGGFAMPLLVRRAGAARERFAEVAALLARGDALGRARSAAALQALLLWLADRATPAPGPAERAAAFIDEAFDRPLTVAEVAGAARCSPAHLARAFRRRYGVTVPHRLVQRRVEHARYLLESTDLPVWRVAERCGIPDPQHFNKTVRRLTGASPSALRARGAGALVDPDR